MCGRRVQTENQHILVIKAQNRDEIAQKATVFVHYFTSVQNDKCFVMNEIALILGEEEENRTLGGWAHSNSKGTDWATQIPP